MTEEDYVPSPTGGLWPDPKAGPFRLRIYWARIDGRVECVGLELTSIPNPDVEEEGWMSDPDWKAEPTRLQTSDLRRLNLSTEVAERLEMHAEHLKRWADTEMFWEALPPERRDQLSQRLDELISEQQPSREIVESRSKSLRHGGGATGGRPRQYGVDHFAAVAGVYEAAWREGDSPTKAVAEHWKVSGSTAAKWVARARKLGFLGQTQKGRAGGIRPESKGDEK